MRGIDWFSRLAGGSRRTVVTALMALLALAVAARAGWSTSLPLGASHPLVLLAAIPVAVAILVRPELGVLVLIATQWLSPLFPAESAFTLNRAVGVITLVGALGLRALRVEPRPPRLERFDVLVLALISVAFLSVLVKGSYQWTSSSLWDFVMGYAVYWMMVDRITTWKGLRLVLWVMLICTLVAGIPTIVMVLRSPLPETVRRVYGLQQVNTMGRQGWVAIACVLWLAERWRKGKLALFLLIPVLAIIVLLSGSRTALLSLVAVLAVLGWTLRGKGPSLGTMILLLLIASAVVAATDLAPAAVQRALDFSPVSSAALGGAEQSLDRLATTMAAIRMFLDSPLLGVGFGGFRDHLFAYTRTQFWRAPHVAHNVFASTLAETGLLGFVVLLLVYYEAFRPLRASAAQRGSEDWRAIAYVSAILIGNNVISALAGGAYIDREMFIVFALATITGKLVRAAGREQAALDSLQP